MDKIYYPDTHGAVNASLECVIITIPVTGWYKIAGSDRKIYLEAGTQFILNVPFNKGKPNNLEIRSE